MCIRTIPSIFLAVLAVACVLAGSQPNFAQNNSPKQIAPDHAQQMQAGLAIFKESVRTTLTQHCLKCHNANTQEGDLDLSTRQTLIDSGFLGESVDDSHLLRLVQHADEPHMPKKAAKLPESAITALAKWIDHGAPYDRPLNEQEIGDSTKQVTDADREFWSFAPLVRPEVPIADAAASDIDQFVLGKLQKAGITPNDKADRRTLIRRAYFDLLGLPPHPTEVDQFVRDSDPHAYAKLIERLLNSRHYGERWARHWLDIARFAESTGFEHDDFLPTAYHYRDFVIKSLNSDQPFDEFIRWQIAGDEINPENPLAMAATAFLGAGPFPTQVTESLFESTRYDEIDDMVTNTGLAFLGVSVGCARCHDHKFDPIPASDYYAMAATFVKTVRAEVDLTLEPATPPAKVFVTADGFKARGNHSHGRGYKDFYDNVYFLRRGDVSQKTDVATPGFLQALTRNGRGYADWKLTPPENWERSEFLRSTLANWITDTEHGAGHLAARVIVNRLWQHHFGKGIVGTPNDFGMQGDRPTHPKLLDFLASELIENDWSLKHIHRLMMTSNAYTQSDLFDEARAKVDRENRLLWRFTPQRLEAEAIRDAMLSVSGLLDREMFGPGSLDESMRRRSIYFTIQRSKLIPMMMLFDWPEHLVSIGQRPATTSAPQALMFMNNATARDYAKGFAAALAKRATGKDDKRELKPAIEFAYKSAYGRPATESEMELAKEFLSNQIAIYTEQEPEKAEHRALTDFAQMIMSSNEFVFIR